MGSRHRSLAATLGLLALTLLLGTIISTYFGITASRAAAEAEIQRGLANAEAVNARQARDEALQTVEREY